MSLTLISCGGKNEQENKPFSEQLIGSWSFCEDSLHGTYTFSDNGEYHGNLIQFENKDCTGDIVGGEEDVFTATYTLGEEVQLPDGNIAHKFHGNSAFGPFKQLALIKDGRLYFGGDSDMTKFPTELNYSLYMVKH